VTTPLAEADAEGDSNKLPVTLALAEPKTVPDGSADLEAAKDSLTDPEGVATPLADTAPEGESTKLPVTLPLADL
jgi:hypothetical protein